MNPSSVRSRTFTRRSAADGRRRTRPRDSSRSTSPVTLEASQASVCARLPHRHGTARLDEVQHVTLRRRQLELGGDRRQMRAVHEEELHQQRPGVAGGFLPARHRRQYSSFHQSLTSSSIERNLESMTTTLKLIPLDDAVAFPGMPVTVPAEVGVDSRVLLVPAGTPATPRSASSPRCRARRARRAAPRHSQPAPSRPCPAPRYADPDGGVARRGRRAPRRDAPASLTRASSSANIGPSWRKSSISAATTAASSRSSAPSLEPGAPGGYGRILARFERRQKLELLGNARRRRAADARAAVAAGAAGGAARAQTHSRRRRDRARRSSSASISSASRWTRFARSSARTTDRSPRNTGRRLRPPGCPTPCSSRPNVSCRGSSAWATSNAEASMIRTYLDWLHRRALVEAVGGAPRPAARAGGARRRPRRVSTTSSSGSPNTWRCASCAPSAASPTIAGRARS